MFRDLRGKGQIKDRGIRAVRVRCPEKLQVSFLLYIM